MILRVVAITNKDLLETCCSVFYKMNLKTKTNLVKNKSQEQVEAAATTKKRYRI